MPIPTSWDSSFSVGNDLMDSQHQRLLSICSKVAALVADDESAAAEGYHEALHDLAEYTRAHFSAEEALLRNCNYPQLNAHMAEHSECLEQLNDFLLAASQGVIAREQLHRFVSNWWVNHVRDTDTRYREFLRASG